MSHGTVPLKGKLTVSTRNSSFENWVSRIENRVTLEEFFEDLEQRFWGNDLILENKTIAMNKTIDARLCSRKPALNVCKYSFVLCISYKAHAARISTAVYDPMVCKYDKCTYNFGGYLYVYFSLVSYILGAFKKKTIALVGYKMAIYHFIFNAHLWNNC